MSKRKLSRQQRWRVEKIQAEREKRAAKHDAQEAEQLAAGEFGAEQAGRVIAHFGRSLEVRSANGAAVRCHLRANLQGLVTGDTVIWREGQEGSGVVVAAPSATACFPAPTPRAGSSRWPPTLTSC